MQEIYCIVKVIKFGDGDEPNLCRLKKVDVNSTFILKRINFFKGTSNYFLLKRKRKMSYIESPHSKSFMIRAGTRCTLYKFTCTVQSGLPSVSCRPSTFYATNVARIITINIMTLLNPSWLASIYISSDMSFSHTSPQLNPNQFNVMYSTVNHILIVHGTAQLQSKGVESENY